MVVEEERPPLPSHVAFRVPQVLPEEGAGAQVAADDERAPALVLALVLVLRSLRSLRALRALRLRFRVLGKAPFPLHLLLDLRASSPTRSYPPSSLAPPIPRVPQRFMSSAPSHTHLIPNAEPDPVYEGDGNPGGDRKRPYGSFDGRQGGALLRSGSNASGSWRSSSFNVSMPFNPPLNRYGMLSNRRHQRIVTSPDGQPQSMPQLPMYGDGGSMPKLSLKHRSDSAFSSILEVSKSTVYLPKGECTATLTVFNMANCLIGSGILGLPFALAVGGWAGLVVMFISTVGTSYTGKIIGRCIEHLLIKFPNTGRDRYQDMAELCCDQRWLGRLFKYTINLSIVLELWGGACSRIVLQGSNLHKVFPDYSETFFMTTCTVILLPSVFIGMEYLAYLSMLGLTSSVLLLCGVLVSGVNRGISEDTVAFRMEGLPITFGIILFSYSGHAVFPQIYRSMYDKTGYEKAVDSAFYISFTFYAIMAAGGYLFWGSGVYDQITLNLPEGISADSVVLLVVLNTMLSYPLIMTAPIEATEDFLGVTEIRYTKPCQFVVCTVFVRSLLVLGTLAVALTVTNFALIATFIGAVFTMSVSLIFPSVIYLKLLHYGLPEKTRSKRGLSSWEISWNIFLIILGIFGMITGVWQGLKQLS